MKKKIIIRGKKVHDVGYRLFLMDAAEDFGIENFDVRNLKENGKEIVAIKIESSDENVNDFINFVKTNFPEHADVDRQSIETDNYEGKIKSFDAFERGFIRYQTAKIANAGIGMLYKEDLSLQKQDQMLEKQDITIGILRDVKQDTEKMLEKQDKMLEKQDKMLGKQDTTISILRDIKQDTAHIPTMHEEIDDLKIKYEQIQREINKIKEVLDVPVSV